MTSIQVKSDDRSICVYIYISRHKHDYVSIHAYIHLCMQVYDGPRRPTLHLPYLPLVCRHVWAQYRNVEPTRARAKGFLACQLPEGFQFRFRTQGFRGQGKIGTSLFLPLQIFAGQSSLQNRLFLSDGSKLQAAFSS